jgi:Xaa-Pro aminopeptidase
MRALACLVALSAACAHAPAQVQLGMAWSEQIALREEWLQKRHALLLEQMRRHGVAMWIVVNEEFHDDPLTEHVAPPRPYAGNRDLFVFADAGDKGLRRYAITSFAEESLSRFFEAREEFRDVKKGLRAVALAHEPKTIALSIEPPGARPSRGVTRSLTLASYEFLADALGQEMEARFVPAAPLLEEYLDTRLPEEREPYARMVALTEELARRALSREVIEPGRTTVGEVRRWLYDALGARGLTTWFQPDLRVQRRGMANDLSRGFLAVAGERVVIERGDLLHVDFGISFLGLHTDMQRMAYVLREGEADAPAGLRAALANTNAMQDALMQAARPGRSSADVYDEAMAAARGFQAQIYSHPLGAQGHALGPSIDFRAAQRKEPPRPLRAGSYLAVELNTRAKVAEWDGQEVFAMEEDPAELTTEGYRFFGPRQTAFFLLR